MADGEPNLSDDVVQIVNPHGRSSVVLVCEHASNHIPPVFDGLGLVGDARDSHAAWDIGAMGVARRLSDKLDAPLVASTVSRLVYDCNRPPHAPDAMPARSELIDIPGNATLTERDRTWRAQTFYEPFRSSLRAKIADITNPFLVTVHSFTPVYHGQRRSVDIGILHDADTRLADAMLAVGVQHTALKTQRNEPYGPEHGVTHTLTEHALAAGHPNVMLEIRNDLIRSAEEQARMGDMLAGWITAAVQQVAGRESVGCTV